MRWPRPQLWLILSLLGISGILAQLIHTPYSVILPGSVQELAPKIKLPSDKQRDSGWLAFTAVRVRQASYADWLAAKLDRGGRLVPTAEVRPPGVSEREYVSLRSRSMEESKKIASVVALRQAGYHVEVGGQGTLVERVLEGSPAENKLQVGDVVIGLDELPISTAAALGEQIRKRPIGEQIYLRVLRQGQELRIQLSTAESPTNPGQPRVGIQTSNYVFEVRLPFELEVQTDNVLGSSAGLMVSLGLLDALTAGDLGGGHRVAGTGTISVEGRVGQVGSVAEKVIAAEREGADVFLVPRENLAEAEQAARNARVIGVDDFEGAVAALLSLGGQAAQGLLAPSGAAGVATTE